MNQPRTKFLKEHRDGCHALAHARSGFWSTAWCCIPEDRCLWLDTLGRKNGGGHPWIVFICNDIGCEAQIAVYADDLLAEVPNV